MGEQPIHGVPPGHGVPLGMGEQSRPGAQAGPGERPGPAGRAQRGHPGWDSPDPAWHQVHDAVLVRRGSALEGTGGWPGGRREQWHAGDRPDDGSDATARTPTRILRERAEGPRRSLLLAAGALIVLLVVAVRVSGAAGALGGTASPGSGAGAPVASAAGTSEPAEPNRMTPGTESSGPAVAAGGDDRLEETPRAAPAPGDLSEAGEGPIDWWAVLSDIDGLRSAALRQRDAAAIAQYAEPGSTAWEEDSHLIADLRARGLVPEGLSTRIVGMEQVQVLTASGPGGVPGAREQGAGELGQPTPRDSDPPDSGGERGPSDVDPDEVAHEAVLVVVDERSAYRLVDPSGAVVAEIPASGLRRWQLRLAPGPPGAGRWLLRSAEPMP